MNKKQSVWKMKWLYTVVLLDIFMWTVLEIESAEVPNWLRNSLLMDAKESSSDILHHRSKRSLFNFQNVILCIQPWAQVLSTYGDYGCYCGYKGAGQPLDDTDKCCYNHDLCYDEADALTKSFSESAMGSYFSDYDYTCNNHLVECVFESPGISAKHCYCVPYNVDKNSPYQNALCECDRNAAECFANNRRSYSPKLFDIDTNKYCGGNADYHDLHLDSHSLFKLYSCSLEMNQDRCCVDQGYNSAYALCCNDKIRLKPGMDSTIVACCGSRVFDTRLRMCCYGVLHPNVQHLRCCGNVGQAIDTSFQKCVNGKPENLKIHKNQLDNAQNTTLN